MVAVHGEVIMAASGKMRTCRSGCRTGKMRKILREVSVDVMGKVRVRVRFRVRLRVRVRVGVSIRRLHFTRSTSASAHPHYTRAKNDNCTTLSSSTEALLRVTL